MTSSKFKQLNPFELKSALTEYKGMLDTIVSSDDASIKEYYGVANKEMDQAADSRKQFYAFV